MKPNFLVGNSFLPRFCANVARFVGLLSLLFAGVVVALLIIFRAMPGARDPNSMDDSLHTILTKLPTIILIGFGALIIAEFISFLLTSKDEPKWILRHGDKIIYGYVAHLIIMHIYISMQTGNPEEPPNSLIHVVQFHGVSVMRILILIGIAIILRKVVRIIKESKTLV